MIKDKQVKKRIQKKTKECGIEALPFPASFNSQFDNIARSLAKTIDKKVFEKKYAPHKEVLTLVGTGVFIAASLVMPGLPLVLQPFLNKNYEEKRKAWKRFNIPYLEKTIKRLEQQKMVEIGWEKGLQVVKITQSGKRRIVKYALDELQIKEPKHWNGKWTLVTYDIPEEYETLRKYFRSYLLNWKFYPIEKSVYLHAFPCKEEIEFLREYLTVGKYVNIFNVDEIENDKIFRDYFGV